MQITKVSILVLAIAVLAIMTSSAATATVLFEENFNGTAGNNLTTLSWSQDGGGINISATLVDSGNSAVGTASGWNYYSKALPGGTYTLLATEELVLTYTLKMPSGNNTMAGVIMRNTSDLNWNVYLGQYIGNPPGEFLCYHSGNRWDPNPLVPAEVGSIVDFKVRETTADSAMYWRNHGTTDWNLIQEMLGYGMNNLDKVQIALISPINAAYQANIDSIKIVTNPIPEPSSLLALACGLGGLGGILRRLRR